MSFKRPFRNNPLPNRERENNDLRSSSPTENEDTPDSEQEFIQKLEIYAVQLKQLEAGTHSEFIKTSKKIEGWLDDQKLRSQILHEHKIDEIHSQYDREFRTCDHDCTLEKKKLQDNLISLCEDLKRHLEKDKTNIELTVTGDVLEMKPTVTRKLRRRVQEMAPNMTGVGFNGNSTTKLSYWGEINLYNTNWIVKAKKAKNELPPSPTNREENVIPTMTSFGNLFGSMGVDLDDGKSLLNHFRASLTRNSGHSDSGSHSNGRPSTLLAQSLLASIKPSPVATAVVSGLMGSVNTPPPKRKKPQSVLPQAQLNMLLPQNDIYSDLTLIHRACGKPSASLTTGTSRKHGSDGSAPSARTGPVSPPLTRGLGGDEGDRHGRRGDRRSDRYGHPHHGHYHGEETSSSTPRVWIDDGALFIGQNCYRVGSQVCLESHGCNGTVSGVGVQDIQIKRTSDNGIVRINLQQLRLGRYIITPLKPRQ
nr:Sin3 histone deacetylase corepressor complex [Hymenolepis microstoma]